MSSPIRVMLGRDGKPDLLVEAESSELQTGSFDFEVVNGCWKGHFHPNGMISIFGCPGGAWSTFDDAPLVVLTSNQDRLRGYYVDVFDNFDDPNYVAPQKTTREYDDFLDDDIPF